VPDIYAPLEVALSVLGLRSSFAHKLTSAPHTLPTPAVQPELEVDYWAAKTYDWLLSAGAVVLDTCRVEYQLEGVYPSDHYPVIATYELR